MQYLSPYINFGGKAKEALNFYKECLGGEVNIMLIGDSPIADQMPAEMRNSVLHGSFQNGNIRIMGSDMMTEAVQLGNAFSIMIECSSEEEISRIFSKLSEGGKVHDPLSVKFWGAMLGVVIDKFGINWMLDYDKNRQS